MPYFLLWQALQKALLLVFANKQDLPGACNAAEISEEMHLYPPYISKSCYIQSCCATSGQGLHEGRLCPFLCLCLCLQEPAL